MINQRIDQMIYFYSLSIFIPIAAVFVLLKLVKSRKFISSIQSSYVALHYSNWDNTTGKHKLKEEYKNFIFINEKNINQIYSTILTEQSSTEYKINYLVKIKNCHQIEIDQNNISLEHRPFFEFQIDYLNSFIEKLKIELPHQSSIKSNLEEYFINGMNRELFDSCIKTFCYNSKEKIVKDKLAKMFIYLIKKERLDLSNNLSSEVDCQKLGELLFRPYLSKEKYNQEFSYRKPFQEVYKNITLSKLEMDNIESFLSDRTIKI